MPLPVVALMLLLGSATAGFARLAVLAAARSAEAAREAERRERRLLATVRTLLEASRRSSAEVLAVLDRDLREIEPGIDCVVAFVPADDDLRCAYASGSRVAHFGTLKLRRDGGTLPAIAARSGCRVLVAAGSALLPTDRFALAVPMMDEATPTAVAYVSSIRVLAEPANDAIVRAVERASAPFVLAREREADRADATYDGLTGLLAPRAFRRRLHAEFAPCGTTQRRRALCLWFVDTDSFKAVNDAFGHRAGDDVLQAMASLLQAHLVPDLDVAGRNGGDEFCALLRGVGKGRAIARAQAFCDAVRAHDFGLPVRVTASVGVAAHPHDACSSSELLEKADAAMYYSKRNGRDRVSFAAESGNFRSVGAEAENGFSRSS
ncbi:MAG TPA: GGDEF domain-containing protein [Candidatus Tumulicola sp.]|jgi:diguanylate cyclase (GGDEF)-like protein